MQSPRRLSGVDVTGLQVWFTVSVFGVEVPHTQYGYTFETSSRSAWVIVQLPDDDRSQEQPGIDLILDSLVVAVRASCSRVNVAPIQLTDFPS